MPFGRSYNEAVSYDRLEVWTRQFGADSLMGIDECGHLVMRDAAEDSPCAWDVDHIFPKAWLEKLNATEEKIDNSLNLRVLWAATNRSKGDNYPEYVDVEGELHVINDAVRSALAILYKPEIEAFRSRWECVSLLNNGAPGGGHTPEEQEMMAFLSKARLVDEV